LPSAGSGCRLLLDVDSVGHKRHPPEERPDVTRYGLPRPQSLEYGDEGLTKLGSQFGYRLETPFGQRHQFPGGELSLGVSGANDTLLHPVLLQCSRCGLVRIREGICKSNK
jgi:hypothetical protein